MNKVILCSIFLFFTNTVFPQLTISSANINYTVDFDNTVPGVNSGTYNGTGFSANPSEGQLNSNAWAATGMSDGDFNFGEEATSGDFASGTSDGGIGQGGFYAFDVESNNFAFGIQPNGSDWTPGTVKLNIQNNTGFNITDLNVSYDVYVYNDQGRSNAFNFSYSTDNLNYIDVTALNLASTEAEDISPSWSQNHKSTVINGLNILSGNYIYLRWSGDEISGTGSMDEFALDNITINATTGAASPTLVFFQSTNSSVNEDDGTYNLIVQIQNPSSSNSTTADVVLTEEDNADVNNYSTQTITFPASSSVNELIPLTITDDILKEGNETLTFTLQNFSGGNSAQGGAITSFKLTIIDNDIPKIVINEILADPPDGIAGDANGDGTRGSEDEFVEIVNAHGSPVDMSNWTLNVSSVLKHTFHENTIVPDGESIVIFSGGNPAEIPGIVQTASEGNLALANSGEEISLKDENNILIDSYSYGEEGNNNESLARNPDIIGDFVGHTFITTNLVNFSPGRDNTDNHELPVELTSFSANIFDNNIELNWQTATEVNNFGFDVQRKTKFSNWEKIGFVKGFGNSNSAHDYFFIDKNLNPGTYSYRLKQIDIDGKSEYSKILTVELKNNFVFELKQNYPNPFNPVTKISYTIPQKSYVSLKVFNVLGEEVADLVHEKELPGKYSVVLSTDDYNLPSGIYFYSLHYKNFAETRKMIVLK